MANEKMKGVPFKELLSKAHASGKLHSIETELVHADYEHPFFVFKATVTMSPTLPTATPDGTWTTTSIEGPMSTFEAHGDAGNDHRGQMNTSSMIVPHLMRMAETRAIARALRWATNTGEVAAQELGGVEEEKPEDLISQIMFHLDDPLITDDERAKTGTWLGTQPKADLLKGAIARLLRLIGERSSEGDIDFGASDNRPDRE